MTTIFGNNYNNIAAAGETPIYQLTSGGAGGGYTLRDEVIAPYNTISEIEFADIPAGVTHISVMWKGLGIFGVSNGRFGIQIGNSGGYLTTGYYTYSDYNPGSSWGDTNFAGRIGSMDIKKQSDIWHISGITWFNSSGATPPYVYGGYATLSGDLDRIRLSAQNPYNFTEGSASISYI